MLVAIRVLLDKRNDLAINRTLLRADLRVSIVETAKKLQSAAELLVVASQGADEKLIEDARKDVLSILSDFVDCARMALLQAQLTEAFESALQILAQLQLSCHSLLNDPPTNNNQLALCVKTLIMHLSELLKAAKTCNGVFFNSGSPGRDLLMELLPICRRLAQLGAEVVSRVRQYMTDQDEARLLLSNTKSLAEVSGGLAPLFQLHARDYSDDSISSLVADSISEEVAVVGEALFLLCSNLGLPTNYNQTVFTSSIDDCIAHTSTLLPLPQLPEEATEDESDSDTEFDEPFSALYPPPP